MRAILTRLVRITLIICLFPLLHFVYALVTSLHAGESVSVALRRFALETAILGLSPLAAVQGRYPTTFDVINPPLTDILLWTASILLFWVIIALLVRFFWRFLSKPIERIPRRIRFGAVGILMLAIGLWILLPNLPTGSTAHIRIDTTDTLGTFPPYQRGFSQGGEGQMMQAGYFETAMERLGELNPRLVRIDHVYDYYNVLTIGEDGAPSYNWTELDRIVDAIFASGAEPFICLSYVPPALAGETVYGPPTDLQAWEDLVYETVYHFNVERDLNIRYWEVWNEPNLSTFWTGTLEDYLALYGASARGALRAGVSSAIIGGAGFISDSLSAAAFFVDRKWVNAMARYTQENDLPLGFISWHIYDLNPKVFAQSIEEHARWVAGIEPEPELILGEWNFSSAYHPNYDNGESAGFLAASLNEMLDSSLSQAFLFEPIDGGLDWEGRWGMMRADGSIKPTYNVFRLLDALNGERLSVQSDHRNTSAMATRNDEEIAVVLWNYRSGHPTLTTDVTLVNLPPNATITAQISGVDSEHGNPYTRPDNVDMLIETQTLETDDAGQVTITLTIPENGMRLIQLVTE